MDDYFRTVSVNCRRFKCNSGHTLHFRTVIIRSCTDSYLSGSFNRVTSYLFDHNETYLLSVINLAALRDFSMYCYY